MKIMANGFWLCQDLCKLK